MPLTLQTLSQKFKKFDAKAKKKLKI